MYPTDDNFENVQNVRKKKWTTFFLAASVITATLFFLGKYFFINWDQIKGYHISFSYGWLLFSVVLWTLSYTGFALTWRFVLQKITPSNSISCLSALKIYMLTEMTKYLPGKIWTIAARVYLGGRIGIEKKDLFVASMVDAVMGIISLLLTGVVLFSFSFSSYFVDTALVAVVCLFAGFIFLHPRFFYPMVNFALCKIGKDVIPAESQLAYLDILKIAVLYSVAALVLLTSFYFFVFSFLKIPLSSFAIITSAFGLGAGLGLAAVFSPSGLGVREGVLAGVLQLIIPLPLAIITAVLARLWMTVCEILFLGFVLIIDRVVSFLKNRRSMGGG